MFGSQSVEDACIAAVATSLNEGPRPAEELPVEGIALDVEGRAWHKNDVAHPLLEESGGGGDESVAVEETAQLGLGLGVGDPLADSTCSAAAIPLKEQEKARADPSQHNSAGQTSQQLVQQNAKPGSEDEVLSALDQWC